MMTNKADVTGMTRFRFASTMRIAVSVAEPKPLLWTSRAGAIVPGTRNALTVNIFKSQNEFVPSTTGTPPNEETVSEEQNGLKH